MRRFDLAACASLLRPLLRLGLHGAKLEPFSRSSVSPFWLRLRDWSTWNTPELKSALSTLPAVVDADVRRAVPLRMSTNDPIGTCRAWLSGTNVRPLIGDLYFCAARAPARESLAPRGRLT